MIRTRRAKANIAWVLTASALVAMQALAFVPAPTRLADAVADTNRAAGRGESIKLELSLAIGDRVEMGTGELVSHPTGLARLELHGSGGLIERHLLRGTERLATRNGEPLDDARFFLPPVFLLQAESGATLRAALASFGIAVDLVGLAPCGDLDCYVLGDPQRAVPRPPYPPIRGLEEDEQDAERRDSAGSDDELASRVSFSGGGTLLDEREAAERAHIGLTGGPEGTPIGIATLWIDLESYDIRRLGSRSGVHVTFGPAAVFGDLRVPSWIRIEEPEKSPVQFTVLRATKVSAPAGAFDEDWLHSY